MNILHLVGTYHPTFSGGKFQFKEISERLVERGHKVRVIISAKVCMKILHEEINEVSITRIPSMYASVLLKERIPLLSNKFS